MVVSALLENALVLGTALLSVLVAVLAWRNRPADGAVPLAGLMLAVAVWALAHLGAHLASGALDTTLDKVQWLGVLPLSFVWAAFVLDYTGQSWWRRPLPLAALGAIPAVLAVAIWLPGDPLGVWAQLAGETGVAFWGYVGVSYSLLAAGSLLMIRYVVALPGPFRGQGLAVVAAIAAAWAGSIISVFELFGNLHLHAATLGFAAMGGFLLWGILGRRLTNLGPIARRTVMERLAAGVVVIDRTGAVVTMNPAARDLLDVPEAGIGRDLDRVVDEHPALRDWLTSLPEAPDSADAEFDLGDRIVRCESSHITDTHGQPLGWVVLIHDVTTEREREQELETQRDRMERFASIVSHDLRNPLNVASGRIELAREVDDSEHLLAAQEAHERMEELIDDVLTLARQGDGAVEAEPVDVGTAANRSWQHIATDSAELTVATETTVEADRQRLHQLLENLFRNAVEHGGETVTVRVGDLEDGFYVEDDGPGIPPDERSAVFEAGHSDQAAGTGLGLTIVEEIADAHDWEIDLRASDDGGARFEIQTAGSR